MELIPQ